MYIIPIDALGRFLAEYNKNPQPPETCYHIKSSPVLASRDTLTM